MAYTDIDRSSDYFETVTYSGNGTGQDITTLDFQPDWLWIKRRDAVGSHRIQDSIRGTTNYLQSDKTDAEASGGDVDAFLSNGFSLSGGATAYNVSGGTYVGWSWLGGGTASSNTDGSITSSVSANTTSGFSIVSFVGNATSGATVGHGLGVAPKVVIIKGRDSALGWRSYFAPLGATKYLELDSTAGEASNTNFMNDTAPTNQVFYLGNGTTPNKNGENYIAYCFSEKKGFSKFGSYTGNGNLDGPFIYTGFKPAMVLYKNSSSVADWIIYDNKRIHSGTQFDYLEPNTSDAEGFLAVDFLSNGFKVRDEAGAKFNTSGDKYIYMCFAESPFTTSTGIPTTAR